MKKKIVPIDITFINHQNKVFDFSNIVLKNENGDCYYSDFYVENLLHRLFGHVILLKKQSHKSPNDCWDNTSKIIDELKHEIFIQENKLKHLKEQLDAIEDSKSYITHVNSCQSNIEWL